MDNDILTEDQVANLLGCSVGTVRERALFGDIPGIKFGRSWRFPRPALIQALSALALENRQGRREPPSLTNLTRIIRR